MSFLFFLFRASDDVAPEVKETDTFDGVDLQTEKLSHPTANRAKPPQRRPPSGLITVTQVSDLFLFIKTFNLLYKRTKLCCADQILQVTFAH